METREQRWGRRLARATRWTARQTVRVDALSLRMTGWLILLWRLAFWLALAVGVLALLTAVAGADDRGWQAGTAALVLAVAADVLERRWRESRPGDERHLEESRRRLAEAERRLKEVEEP